jgi:DNA-directed RNA polymerase omega subunit
MARITIEDGLRRVNNRYQLVHVVAKRVRQLRQGSRHLVSSLKNEDIVIALREVAAAKVNVLENKLEPQNKQEKQEKKERQSMKKTNKAETTSRKIEVASAQGFTTKPAAKETAVKTSGIKAETTGRKTEVASAQGWTTKPAARQTAVKTSGKTSGIKKEYVKGEDLCRVTFRLPSVAAVKAQSVHIVGDFNDWNIHGSPMKKAQNGDYTITLDLTPGKEYHFRYLIDESKWENDWNADKYVRSPYGDSDNSVVIV